MAPDRTLSNAESNFLMLEKQVRMLLELVEHSSMIQGKMTSAAIAALNPEAEYVVIERKQLDVVLEGIDLHVFLLSEPLLKKGGSNGLVFCAAVRLALSWFLVVGRKNLKGTKGGLCAQAHSPPTLSGFLH